MPKRLKHKRPGSLKPVFIPLLLAVLLCACGGEPPAVTEIAEPAVTETLAAGEGAKDGETEQPAEAAPAEDTAEEAPFDPWDVALSDTPGSSCFSQVGYDGDHECLVVTFRDSGQTYAYFGFPQSEWQSFSAASSLGSYYNSYIKGSYEGERL